jgi:hypothetical protein
MLEPFTPPRDAIRVVSHDAARGQAPAPGPSLKDTPNVTFKLSEARLLRAYLALILVPWSLGTRSVQLARFGTYEVRLVEFEHDLAEAGPALWVELYRHDTGESLDACGCDEFEAAVCMAQDFMARASVLERGKSE